MADTRCSYCYKNEKGKCVETGKELPEHCPFVFIDDAQNKIFVENIINVIRLYQNKEPDFNDVEKHIMYLYRILNIIF